MSHKRRRSRARLAANQHRREQQDLARRQARVRPLKQGTDWCNECRHSHHPDDDHVVGCLDCEDEQGERMSQQSELAALNDQCFAAMQEFLQKGEDA